MATAFFLLIDFVNSAGAIRADEDGRIDPAVAASLFDLSGSFLQGAGFASGVLMLATAFVALRTGFLPRWLGWVTLVIGIASVRLAGQFCPPSQRG